MDRLKREIDDILNEDLFRAYHEERGGHTICRHVGINREELKARIRHLPYLTAPTTYIVGFFTSVPHMRTKSCRCVEFPSSRISCCSDGSNRPIVAALR